MSDVKLYRGTFYDKKGRTLVDDARGKPLQCYVVAPDEHRANGRVSQFTGRQRYSAKMWLGFRTAKKPPAYHCVDEVDDPRLLDQILNGTTREGFLAPTRE